MSETLTDEAGELQVLQCIASLPTLLDVVSLSAADFTNPKWRRVFVVLETMRAAGHPTDKPLAVRAILDASGALGEPLDAATLETIKGTRVRIEDGEYIARRLMRLSEARRLRSGAMAAALMADREKVDDAREELLSTAFGGAIDDDSIDDLNDVMRAAATVFYQASAEHSDPTKARPFIPLRLCDTFDRVYQAGPGDLCVIAAATGVGKTSAAMTCAMNLAKRDGHAVGIISVEDGREDFGSKAIGAIARMDVSRFWDGVASQQQWSEMTSSVEKGRGIPLFFKRIKSRTLDGVRMAMARMVKARRVKVLFVDYLQAISCHNARLGSPRERIDYVLGELMATAAVLDVPLVLMSQLSRPEKGNPFREPQLSDLKESGTIENSSQCVLMMWITTDNPSERGFGEVLCKVAKLKRGPRGERWGMRRGPGALLDHDPAIQLNQNEQQAAPPLRRR
jgi:replicative DNA helicase